MNISYFHLIFKPNKHFGSITKEYIQYALTRNTSPGRVINIYKRMRICTMSGNQSFLTMEYFRTRHLIRQTPIDRVKSEMETVRSFNQ